MPRAKSKATGPASAAKMATKYKKAPTAPKRFKSAFIIFSASKHKDIKRHLEMQGRPEKTTDIAKLVSEAWKALTPEDREEWEIKAEQDRARYEAEKAAYKGPWKIPANKRSQKDPTAPKRPMSAFLAYSNVRRAPLKRRNPKATNSDLSKMLSKSWKELPQHEREQYMEDEAQLRATYKLNMAEWRKKGGGTAGAAASAVVSTPTKKVSRKPAPVASPPSPLAAPTPSPVPKKRTGASAAKKAAEKALVVAAAEKAQQQQQQHQPSSGFQETASLQGHMQGLQSHHAGMEQHMQHQSNPMGGHENAMMGQYGGGGETSMHHHDAMGLSGSDSGYGNSAAAHQMQMLQMQQLQRQQQQQMGGGDAGMGPGGLFGAGAGSGSHNPYGGLQGSSGLGGGGGMDAARAAAFGLNPAAAANPYLANALMNQGGYGMQSAGGPGGSLSALMGQQYSQNTGGMPQLPNNGLYGNNLGGYNLGGYDG